MLLTVDAHLGHDYLDRLEHRRPRPGRPGPRAHFVESHPYLRTVWTWGAGRRRWAAPVAELATQRRRQPTPCSRPASGKYPRRPDGRRLIVGQHVGPQGRWHSHGAAVRHAHNLWQMRDLVEQDVLYTPMPLFWVGGFSFSLIAAMHAGATLVFQDQFEPDATLRLLEAERRHPGAGLAAHGQGARRPSDVRGATCRRSGRDVRRLLPQAQQTGADVPEATSLGMTETLGTHTFDVAGGSLPPDKDGSFGQSVRGVEHKVVDPVMLEDQPTGVTGELWVRGYSLMLGLHKHERSATFTADGWYRTGDGGYFDDDGHFYFTGRLGDLIKSSGMNVTPATSSWPSKRCPRSSWPSSPASTIQTAARTWWAAMLRRARALDEGEARKRSRGDRLVPGTEAHRRVRRPGRAALARLGQGRPPPPGRHPPRAVRGTCRQPERSPRRK